jgi:hypothetical protein
MPAIFSFVKMAGRGNASAKHEQHAWQRDDAREGCGVQLAHR